MLSFDDIWTPAQPLPGRAVLGALAERLAAAWGCGGLAGRVKIVYNPRLRSTAGRAFLDEARVELNTRLLREHPDQFIATLAHELAHMVAHRRFGRVQPHGRHFASLMRQVGLPAGATHSLPVAHLRRARGRFLYLHRCSDCGYSFIARSIRRNCYCRACGPDMSWRVLRAADTAAGRSALENARSKLSLTR